MEKYEYHLAQGYAIYNSVAINQQSGSYINFLISYYNKRGIKKVLSKSFDEYVKFVRKQSDCPEIFKNKTVITFNYANKSDIYKKNKMKKELCL